MARITGIGNTPIAKRDMYPLFYAQVCDFLRLPVSLVEKVKYIFPLMHGMSHVYGLFHYSVLYYFVSRIPSSVKRFLKRLSAKFNGKTGANGSLV